MSQFITNCQKTVLNKKEASPTYPVIKSTYQTDYSSPKIKIRDTLKTLVDAALPPDYLAVDTANRIMPVAFQDIFRNCISASIGEKLELKFTDGTPDWKYSGRRAASKHWLEDTSSRKLNTKQSKILRSNEGKRPSKLGNITEEVLSDQTYTIPDEVLICNYYYNLDVNKDSS